MSFFDDLIANPTLTGVRSTVIGYAHAAGLAVTSWMVGSVGQQVLEVCTQIGYAAERARARVQRGFASLDTSTDPGDADAFDPTNKGLTPAPGFLSNLGANFYGTERTEETFASGYVTFVNAGTTARTFKPYALTFTWTLVSPPPTRPTYRNSADPSVYTNPDGSVTVAAGTSKLLPIVAEERGTGSNTPPNALTLTTTLLGCSASNGSAVLAVEREAADTYRTRCRQAPARLSFGAPADAILYLSTKNLDGTPLLNASGNPVNINRASCTNDSDTGIVNAFFASPSGAAEPEDVDAANANIEVNSYAVMDCATYTGAAADEVIVSVTGSVRVKDGPGVSVLAVRSAIVGSGSVVGALPALFSEYPIGGKTDTPGTGFLYTSDMLVAVANSFPGLYDVHITTPLGATTALSEADVAKLQTSLTDWTVNIV